MKKLIVLILLILSPCISAQQFPNNFRLANYLEVFGNDSILVFFNKNGVICRQECADVFRVARFDTIYCNVTDTVRDYYLDGSLQFESLMNKNALNGPAVYYHPDGVIKQSGNYKNDLRDGLWKYYYPNGRLEKEFYFINGYPTVVTLLSPDGDTLVNDGNGIYTGAYLTKATENAYAISGQIKNYLMEGEWTLKIPQTSQLLATETIKEGKLIKGNSGYETYRDSPKIKLQGYVPNENINIYMNTTYCRGTDSQFNPRQGSDKYFFGDTFFRGFLKDLKKLAGQNIPDQWLLIGIHLGSADNLEKLIVFSSRDNNEMEEKVYNLITSKYNYWKSRENNGIKTASEIIFTIIIKDNNIMIPASNDFLQDPVHLNVIN
jgi:hypothetical protein